jgi:hypothetical protein
MIVILGGALAVVAGGMTALAASSGSNPSTPATTVTASSPSPAGGSGEPPGEPPPEAQVPDVVARAYGVFRRPAATTDALPAAVADHMGGTGLGVNAAHARHLGVGASGTDYYLVPGKNALCLSTPDLLGCSTADQAARDGMVGTMSCSGDVLRIFGAVPDGVSALYVVSRSGHRTQIAPNGNLFELTVSKYPETELPTTISWQDGGGAEHKLPVPVSCG